jgi:hypothetical protein
LLIIVGTAPLPSGLRASLHDGKNTLLLTIQDESSTTQDPLGKRAETM